MGELVVAMRGDLPLRPEIVSSWRRVERSGLAPDARVDPERAEPVDPSSRLRRAAEPVLAELAAALDGFGYTLILADQDARLIDIRFGEPALRPALEQVGAVLGGRFTEATSGTNSIATAFEMRRGIAVHGPEHYLEAFRRFACYGLPITDPGTRRAAGVLDITCRAEDTNSLLRPFLLRGVRDIEARLLGDTRRAHRRLLEDFDTACALTADPVLALGPDLVLANTAANDLLEPPDHAAIRTIADEIDQLRATSWRGDVHLSSGERITAEAARTEAGIVLRLHPSRPDAPIPRRRARPPTGSDWHAPLRADLARHQADGASVLIRGEPGTGRRSVARSLAIGLTGTIDAATAGIADITALPREVETIVVTDADLLTPTVAAALDHRLGDHGPRLILTTSTTPHGPAAALAARCPIHLDLPTLRARRDRIPTHAAARLRQRAPGLRLTPPALRALAAQDWPGNLRELESVLDHIAEHRSVGDVTAADLPAGYRDDRAPVRGALWQAEREAILDALRACAGNKVHAAIRLGIGRTTLYRHIRRLGIDVPALRRESTAHQYPPSPDTPTEGAD